jgi:hypothetical protein
MKCEYCNSELLSKASLAAHQKKAIYCIKEQQKIKGKTVEIQRNTHMCEGCEKQISSAHTARHKKTCNSLINLAKNQTLISENQTLRSELAIYKELSDKDRECIREIAKQPMVSNIIEIEEQLTHSETQPDEEPEYQLEPLDVGEEYPENVVYILTTLSLEKDRRYILGKASNLTNRLSTYNKTDEHKVVFYQECKNKEIMNLLEPLVFQKLEKYREQANRERFVLPENHTTLLFVELVQNCIKFLEIS